ESVNPGEADSVLNIMLTFGWIIIVVFIIAIITSAISIYFYIGNKKPKAASIMMIITGVVVGLGTALTGFLPALLFLIAGIVVLKYKKGIQKTMALQYMVLVEKIHWHLFLA